MIDVHSHILPGIDDGSKDLLMSLEIAKSYEKAGFTHVAATPHFIYGTPWSPTGEVIKKKLDELRSEIKEAGLSLKVFPGMEIAFDPMIGRLVREKGVIPIAESSYYLIEPQIGRAHV